MGMTTFDYDVAVIGSGPSGQRAAVQAAKLDRRTLLVFDHPTLAECYKSAAFDGVNRSA